MECVPASVCTRGLEQRSLVRQLQGWAISVRGTKPSKCIGSMQVSRARLDGRVAWLPRIETCRITALSDYHAPGRDSLCTCVRLASGSHPITHCPVVAAALIMGLEMRASCRPWCICTTLLTIWEPTEGLNFSRVVRSSFLETWYMEVVSCLRILAWYILHYVFLGFTRHMPSL